jgi:tripartite-type tricarboxylate transporter receptor subunit TctC
LPSYRQSGRAGIDKKWGVMLNRRNFVTSAAAVAAAGILPNSARAAYPDHPIRILVGYAAGGGVDIVARLLSEPLKAGLGQTVIVENRTGASAMIASNAVAKAAPDGYTWLMAASGEVAINQHLFKDKMTYDASRELVPVALIGIVPCVVVVADTTPVHNPRELIAYCKANDGKLSFSSSGVGNPQQLAGELMNTMAGIRVLHVPYRGSAPAVTDVATGAVTMSFSSLAAALPLISSGKLRAVAVTSRERMPQLPDVAPLSEGAPGLAGYELLNWFGMFGTAGTAPEIVDRVNAIVNRALKGPEIGGKLSPQGIVPRLMTAPEYRTFVGSETEKFGKIIERANIKLAN